MLAALKMWNTGVSAQTRCTGLQFLFHHMEFSSRSVPASFPGKIFLIGKIYYLANLTPVFLSFCLTWWIELLALGCQPSPLTLAQDWHPPCLPHRRYSEFPLFNWNTLQPCWTPGTAVSRLQTAVVYNAGISLQLFQLLNKNCCCTPLLFYSTEFPKLLSTDPAALQDFVCSQERLWTLLILLSCHHPCP